MLEHGLGDDILRLHLQQSIPDAPERQWLLKSGGLQNQGLAELLRVPWLVILDPAGLSGLFQRAGHTTDAMNSKPAFLQFLSVADTRRVASCSLLLRALQGAAIKQYL